jgi:hypothetical protein
MPFNNNRFTMEFRKIGRHHSGDYDHGNSPFGIFQHDDAAATILILHVDHHVNNADITVVISVSELFKLISNISNKDSETLVDWPAVVSSDMWIAQATRWIQFSRAIYLHKSIIYVPRHDGNQLSKRMGLEQIGVDLSKYDTDRSFIFDFNPRSLCRDRDRNLDLNGKCDDHSRNYADTGASVGADPGVSADATILCVEEPTEMTIHDRIPLLGVADLDDHVFSTIQADRWSM